jgi:hypothetical protein
MGKHVPKKLTLMALTRGAIPHNTFEAFVSAMGPQDAKERVEKFLGYKIKNSDGGKLQPLFDKDGKQLRMSDPDRKPIELPWTWPACLTWKIMRLTKRYKNARTQMLTNLPIPFWQVVDTYLITADGYVVMGMRSNVTKNDIGMVVSTAGGYFQCGDKGVAGGAGRELKEEMFINLDAVSARTIELPLVTQRPASFYDEDMRAPEGRDAKATKHKKKNSKSKRKSTIRKKYKACCPIIGRAIAVQSRLLLRDIVRKIRVDKEAVGVVAIKIDRLLHLRENSTAKVDAQFFQSKWMPADDADYFGNSSSLQRKRAKMTRSRKAWAEAREKSLSSTIISALARNIPGSKPAKEVLPNVRKPDDKKITYALKPQPFAIKFSRADMASPKTAVEILNKMDVAATQLGIVSRTKPLQRHFERQAHGLERCADKKIEILRPQNGHSKSAPKMYRGIRTVAISRYST